MPKSVTFTRILTDEVRNSYDDWGLLLEEIPHISVPDPQGELVTVPGGDTALDMYQAIDGLVHYDVRCLEFNFMINTPRAGWAALFSKIQNFLHGQRVKIIHDDDPAHYWLGRAFVETWKANAYNYGKSQVTIQCTVDPYKLEVVDSVEDWLWDPFSFVDGVIRGCDYNVDGTLEVTIAGSRKPVCPVVVSDTAGITISYTNNSGGMTTATLSAGDNQFANFIIDEDGQTITLSGTGSVQIVFRGGSL